MKQKEAAIEEPEKEPIFEEEEFKVSRKVFKQGYKGTFGNKNIRINDIEQTEDGVKRSGFCIVNKMIVGERGTGFKEAFRSPTHLKGITKYDAYLLYRAGVIEISTELAVELCEYAKKLK
jgi:hypothetical protein